MGVFGQNISQAVYNNILGEGSAFWDDWLIPSASMYTKSISAHNYSLIQHFKKDFPISVQDDVLICSSSFQNMTLRSDNLPSKYIPGLKEINWPNAQFDIDGRGWNFVGKEFNKITCENIHIFEVNKLSNWEINVKHTCLINRVQCIENCNFTAKQIRMSGSDFPKLINCTTTEPVQLSLVVINDPENPYLRNFYTKVRGESGTEHRRRRWKSETPIKLTDIFDISNIQAKSISVYFKGYFKGRVEFTKCKGPSKSNVVGWDVMYYTEL